MPVKIRDTKALKASKENACVKLKQKINTDNNLRPQRKVLGDKTNSASDDNTSILTCETVPPKSAPIEKKGKVCKPSVTETIERPKRARRVPTRYIENDGEKVISKKSNSPSPSVNTNFASPKLKVPIVLLTPVKIPHKIHDSSIIINRPKRICRLPSKFDNSSTSPSKFLSVLPINSSTPLAPKTQSVKQTKRELRSKTVSEKKLQPKKIVKKDSKRKFNEAQTTPHKSPKQSHITSFLKKKLPDTNNNANSNKNNSLKAVQKSPDKKRGINKSKAERNKIRDIDFSIKILDDKKSLKRNSNKADVYEFTFDPSEEPPPAKKQKKKNVSKKPSKPRKVTYKSNYEKNLAKALAVLKNTVAPDKVLEQNPKEANDQASSSKNPESNQVISAGHKVNDKNQMTKQKNDINQTVNRDIGTNANENVGNNSVRVEDTAFDIQADTDNLNYSPVNTPTRTKTPKLNTTNTANIDDPLNLQELSFFDEQPAASSSMNQSIRHPTASPWRIEFGNLPIKWQINTYVKPNMTPALESSFINFNDTKKKHVYTPIVPVNESLPEISESPNLKQTSIMSFIKEVVERSANKKKKKSSPVKNNSLFEDVTHSFVNVENTPAKETLPSSKTSRTPNKGMPVENNANETNTNNDSSVEDKENDSESAEKSNGNDKDLTFFGFNESEDQENTSPTKKKHRSTKSQPRRALQELNTFKGPSRPVLPVAAKTKILQNFDKANELYENMKSATEPPVFPEISIAGNTEVTNVNPTEDNEDSQSVHLFEDIEVVHHHKPIRKSYSKPKRVMFRQRAVEDSDDSRDTDDESSGDEMDESFTLPTIQIKKPTKKRVTKKQKLSKKEEKEAEAWAAGFNSMCENIEEFELVVE
ncbi:probable myosin light chain kinase DDB_G0279831 [Danaus plexippus]|uniref:probable myosin light chain kinase DDB_G0279831 n=1 Tax=Danaus plexippus TaxID=13037 RepID=UPI002AB11E1B|nr:probable myosin light chain kinase DDB_G0279831 [Danaus plexippus]